VGPGGNLMRQTTTLRASRRARRRQATPALRNRGGFTLIEVIVAAVILSTALLAMAGFTVRYQQTESKVRQFSKAQELASARLETVRSAVPYASLDTMERTESTIAGYPGYTRITVVSRIGGAPTDTVDYRAVTVKVLTPGSTQYVTKSSMVAAF
jgi:prepilin-type N-terminal cleavage/methylation domain-containing protein